MPGNTPQPMTVAGRTPALALITGGFSVQPAGISSAPQWSCANSDGQSVPVPEPSWTISTATHCPPTQSTCTGGTMQAVHRSSGASASSAAA